MKQWLIRACIKASFVVACVGLAGCSHTPQWLPDGGTGGGGKGPSGTGGGGAGAGGSGSDAGTGDAGGMDDAGDGGIDESRVNEIRDCMKARWGEGTTRDVLDVMNDFYVCTTPAEYAGDAGVALFEAVIKGWVELDPTDSSRFRLIQ